MRGGTGTGYAISETPMSDAFDRLSHLGYHSGLKVFGSNHSIFSILNKESEKEGLIKTYKNLNEISNLPRGSTIIQSIQSGVVDATVWFPEAKKKYNEIKSIENKWDVRNLIKQGYKRV